MKTLNEQYQLIKEGKGHKTMFLNDAKRQFPNYIRNAATFDEATTILKQRGVINENIVGITPINTIESKKESFELAFEKFLEEAKDPQIKAKEVKSKKVKSQEETEKAELKKPSKQVEEDLDKKYNQVDDKNPDNLIFDQIMMGYYTEMKDPKNADKTMQQLKDIVLKNLAKDPIHYTKDGQFGVKGLGYTTEHPGLGTPKEAKGKYKASGYGDLNESIGRNYPGELEGEYEGELQKIYGADIYDTLKDVLDVSNSEDDFVRKMTMSLTDETNVLPKDSEKKLRIWYRNNTTGLDENIEKFKSDVKKEFEKKPSKKFTPEEIEAKLNKLYPGRAERKKDTPEESKLREVIREIIDEEIEEVRGGGNYGILTINPSGGGGGRRFVPDYLPLPINIRKRFGDHMVYNSANETFYISQILYNNLIKGYADQPAIKKLIMDIPMMVKQLLNKTENYGPSVNLPKEYKTYMPFIAPVSKAKEDKFNKAGDKQYWAEGDFLFPNLNKAKYSSEEDIEENNTISLKESIEKEIAEINKMAEYEVLENKLQRINDAIERRRAQLERLDEDEDMKALTDKKKVKELEKDIKTLEKAKTKLEKIASKKSKGKKKEIIDEVGEEDVDLGLEDAVNQAQEMYNGGLDIEDILVKFNPRMRSDIESRLMS